ncbi:hypothetical protein ACVXG7_17405 [Enterobacter hormaechei]
MLHRQDASLVSIRSWPEFIGETSGYSYIKPKGEIAGARSGPCGQRRDPHGRFPQSGWHHAQRR